VVAMNTLTIAKERKRLRDMRAALAVTTPLDVPAVIPETAAVRKSFDTANA